MQVIEGQLSIKFDLYFILPDDWRPTSINVRVLEDAASAFISDNEGSKRCSSVLLNKYVSEPVYGANSIVMDMRSNRETKKDTKKTRK